MCCIRRLRWRLCGWRLGQSTVFVRSSGGSGTEAFGQQTGIATLRVGSTVVPTDGNGQLWLHYAKADGGRTIPAHRVLDGTFKAEDVAGRMILIGSSSPLLFDLRATPLETAVPGVEIHAQALEQMVSGEHLVRPDYAAGAELLFLAASGALVAWLIAKAGARTAALVGLASIAGVLAASWALFANAGYLFDPVYPRACIGCGLQCGNAAQCAWDGARADKYSRDVFALHGAGAGC